ncbi:tetratricopeptide repeat protein [Roseibium aggregatum]|uniref:Tetratricopeptide repeat protein n=1 Tax=Roseibium aggregatum TaxID=187304 RepID=A0A939J3V6_9HYPH|nr:tetratricopeptide repeat protein [Roseibium aggregatum]MBN9672913.1 tetratricopeptide repeat protein [Roseibium aggregatum]
MSLPSLASEPLLVAAKDKKSRRQDNVKLGQQWLKALGYYTGKIDGLAGLGTQTAIRRFMEDAGLSGRFDAKAATALMFAVDIKEAQDISAEEALTLLPGALRAKKQGERAEKARETGETAEAEKLFRSALAGFEASTGLNNRFADKALEGLASMLDDADRTSDAGEVYERLAGVRETMFGEEHAKTLEALNLLGLNLTAQKRYAEAEDLLKRVLAIRERVLGPNSPGTLTSTGNLGLTLKKLGQFEEAESLLRRALEGRVKVLGETATATQNMLYEMAVFLDDRGRYREAEPFYRRYSAAREKTLGPEAPKTLSALNRLGLNLVDQGRYKEAETLYKRILEARERTLGPDHPDTLVSVGNFGNLYKKMGRRKEAEAYDRRAYLSKQTALGPEHRSTLISLNNLAYNYLVQDRYDEAEKLFLSLYEIVKRKYEADDPDLLLVEHNLGFLYERRGLHDKAEGYYKRVLAAHERVLGPEHPETLSAVADLASNYQWQGRYGDAERLMMRALEGRTRALGEKHPRTLTSMNDLALLYEDQGRLDEAERLFRKTLDLRTEVLGEGHPATLTSVNNMGFIYESLRRYEEAEPYFSRCMTAREQLFGPDNPDTLICVNNLGFLYYRLKRYDEAEPLYERALESREKALGPEHPRTLLSVNNLARLYEKQKRYPEAERLYLRALEAKERALGEDHPSTLLSLNDLADLYHNRKTHDKAIRVWQAGLAALPAWVERTGFEPGGSFELPLALDKYLQSAAESGLSMPEAGRQTLKAQGWFTYDTLDKALADLGARLGADNPATADLLRRKQDVRDKIAGLRRQFAQTFSETGDKEDRRQELQRQITALERQIQDLDQKIAAEAPDLFELSSARPLDVEEAQALLDQDEAIVAFAWAKEAVYVWFIRSDSIDFRAVPRPERLAGLVSDLRSSVDLSVPAQTAQALKGQPERCLLRSEVRGLETRVFNLCSAHELYRALLEPFADELGGVSNLIVVPDGPLEELPFSLLVRKAPDGGDPAWLVRDMAVSLLPTTSSLRVLRTARPGGPDGRDPYLGIAPGDFKSGDGPAGQRGGLAPLPGTLKEVRSLSEILGASGEGTVTGERASEEFVKTAQLQNYRVLSFATHGLLAGEVAKLTDGAIKEPALAFSPSNGGEDGFLTATEAATLKLNADWLLLSACNTAAANDEVSSGYSGLTRAFFFAGAKSLLVSHWSVDDASALTLMLETVRREANGSAEDKAFALRQAMLKLMKEPAYGHPFFWAPFSLIGDNRSRP